MDKSDEYKIVKFIEAPSYYKENDTFFYCFWIYFSGIIYFFYCFVFFR